MPGKRIWALRIVAVVALLNVAGAAVSAAPIVERRGKWGSPTLLRRLRVEAVKSQTSEPLKFTGAEYGFTGPTSILAGQQELILENQGAQEHRVWVLRLPEGLSERELSVSLQAALADGASVMAEVVLGVGESERVEVLLEPGRYALFARSASAPASAAGMVRVFTVAGPGSIEGADFLPYT